MAGEASTEFVGSHEKALNKYGQNGYQGASSDLPGQHTTSGFLPQTKLPDGVTKSFGETGNWQTRPVSKEGYAPSHGMKSPAEPAKVPDANVRRATKQAAPGSFQR